MISCVEAKKKIRGDLAALLNTPAWDHIRTCNNYECSRLWRELNRAIDLDKEKIELMVDEDGFAPFSY